MASASAPAAATEALRPIATPLLAPAATRAPLAGVCALPMATESCAAALLQVPTAVLRTPLAVLAEPIAMELPPLAADVLPSAMLRSEEHTSELQSLMRISYAVFCLKKKRNKQHYSVK